MKHDLENFFQATLITSVLVVCFLALKGLTFTPASMQQKSMIADSRSFSLGLQISPSNKKKSTHAGIFKLNGREHVSQEE